MLSGSEILNYVNLTDGYISCCEAKIYSVFFCDVFLPDKYHRPVSRTFLTSDSVFIFCWKYLFRCYKELSLLWKNGKMNIDKGKI